MGAAARDCAALITAAGRSERMGRPKALLAWGGRTLLAHQCQVLSEAPAAFGQVVVVLGHDADRLRAEAGLPPRVEVVVNARWAEGRSASLEAGAAAIAPDRQAVLVAAVDQPLERSVVQALLVAFDPATHAAAVPTFDGRRGHPLLLSARLLPDLARVSALAEGLRTLVRAHAAATLFVPVASPSIHLDLNTPEALAQARSERR